MNSFECTAYLCKGAKASDMSSGGKVIRFSVRESKKVPGRNGGDDQWKSIFHTCKVFDKENRFYDKIIKKFADNPDTKIKLLLRGYIDQDVWTPEGADKERRDTFVSVRSWDRMLIDDEDRTPDVEESGDDEDEDLPF